MRGLLCCLLALGACGPPPVRTPPVPPPADPASPEGWWIETADEVNASDVGNGVRFTAEGLVVVTRLGKIERIPQRLHRRGPREWKLWLDRLDGMVRQPDADTLLIEIGGKRVTCRRATADESRRLGTQAASAPASEPSP